MYNSQYYTCEEIDERLLQGYLDDYNTQTDQRLTKEQFLTKLGNVFAKENVIDNTAVNIRYFVCDTAADTVAKVLTAAGYELFLGGSIKVKFSHRNTADSATLNINSKGAKALYYGGKPVSASNSWDNNEIVEIYYDGTNYYANNVEGNSNEGIFDISAYNLTEGRPTKYATLAEALGTNGDNIPPIFRKGGMQIKYVSTTDNQYMQYHYIGTDTSITTFTNVANWQEVGPELIHSGEMDDVLQDGDEYLLDNVGRVIYDITGTPVAIVRLQITVEELNTLLTGRTGDDRPNTIPEIVEELSRLKSETYTKAEVNALVPSDITRSQNDAAIIAKDGTILFYFRQANHELAGLMTKNDKIKLDSLQDLSPLVPSQASAQNQLADKDFVNSSIATSTATFKGTFNSVDNLPTTDVDDNDYAFVVTTDAAGNTVYKRYKYSNEAWVFEYDLNNSSFTAAQWAAINSGVTAANAVLKVGTTSASPMTGALFFSNNSYIKNAGGDVVAKVGNNNCFGNVKSKSRIRSSGPVDRVGASETVHMVESPSIVTIVTLTQSEFDALTSYTPNTEYNIVEE